jgi:hypothetical protein
MSFLRRARASVIIAGLWAIAWYIGGFLVNLWQYLRLSITLGFSIWRHGTIGRMVALALVWAVIGAVNGFFFSLILTTLGRRRRERPGLLTVATFGALAGVVLPALFGGLLLKFRMQSGEWLPIKQVIGVAIVGAGLGAVSAIATFGLARAPLSSQELTLDTGTHAE